MTRKEQNKILDAKIESNVNQYKVDRLNAEISAFSSGDLNKYEFFKKIDLNYKPNALDKARFEFSPLGKTFNTGLDKTAQGYQEEGIIKLLKDIRDGLAGNVVIPARPPRPDNNGNDNNGNDNNGIDNNGNDNIGNDNNGNDNNGNDLLWMNDLQLYKKIALEVFSRYNGDKNSFELFTLRTSIGNINNERTKNKKDAQEEFKNVKKNVESEALKEIVKDLEQAIFGDDDNDESLIEGLDKDKLEQEELDRRFKNLIGKKRRESLREYLKESKDVHPQGRVNTLKEYLKKSKDANLQGRANVLKKKLNNSFKKISKDNDERKDNNNDNDDSEDNQISNFVDEALKNVSKEIVNDDAKKLSKEIVNDDPKKVSKEIVNDDAKKVSKEIVNDDANERTYVYLQGSHFQQNKVIIRNNYNVINIYVVYKFDPIASSRDTTFTIQNALFGAIQILKILILQNMTTKDMAYVLMKEISFVIQ